jgi:hypothetical protein
MALYPPASEQPACTVDIRRTPGDHRRMAPHFPGCPAAIATTSKLAEIAETPERRASPRVCGRTFNGASRDPFRLRREARRDDQSPCKQQQGT